MARRLISYRSGDQAEDLAGYLLSQFSAVTSVHRQNDFGIDKICALTRTEGRYVYVGATFGVQVKSKGHKTIAYGGLDRKTGGWREWDVDWLYGQDYPMFIAVVDRRAGRIRIFSTARMWWVIWMRGRPFEVVLQPDLDLEGRPGEERFRQKEISEFGDRRRWTVPLGKPVVDAVKEELEDPTFQSRIHDVMDKWIALDRQNIYNWKLKVPYSLEFMDFTPNEVPAGPQKDWTYAHPNVNANVTAILAALRPGLRGLAFNLSLQGQTGRLRHLQSVAKLLEDFGLADPKLREFVGSEQEPGGVDIRGSTRSRGT